MCFLWWSCVCVRVCYVTHTHSWWSCSRDRGTCVLFFFCSINSSLHLQTHWNSPTRSRKLNDSKVKCEVSNFNSVCMCECVCSSLNMNPGVSEQITVGHVWPVDLQVWFFTCPDVLQLQQQQPVIKLALLTSAFRGQLICSVLLNKQGDTSRCRRWTAPTLYICWGLLSVSVTFWPLSKANEESTERE